MNHMEDSNVHYFLRTLLCKVEPEWEKATLRFEREHVASFDHLNDTYDTCPAPWQPTLAVQTSVSHQFSLQTTQNMPGVTMIGTIFFIPQREPLSFEVKGGPIITSGKEFHRQMENPFTFETETEASKGSECKNVINLPTNVQGKTKTQVKLIFIAEVIIVDAFRSLSISSNAHPRFHVRLSLSLDFFRTLTKERKNGK